MLHVVLHLSFHYKPALGGCYLREYLRSGVCGSYNLNNTQYCTSTRRHSSGASKYADCPRLEMASTAKDKDNCYKSCHDDSSCHDSTPCGIGVYRMRKYAGIGICGGIGRRTLEE